mgnify:CR=1 FL=1
MSTDESELSLMKPICTECGSSNLSRDAVAAWDDNEQDWVLVTYYDKDVWCNDCGAENSMDYVIVKQEG